jgi:hypothetical protein
MKYMLLIYHDEQGFMGMTEDERQALYLEYRQLREELVSRGIFVSGSQLQPTRTASSVRLRNGKQLTTDGPFAETKEQLGGYFLIEAETVKDAQAVAGRIPSVRMGTVEVRALA